MSNIRFGNNPGDVKKYGTQELRDNFLLEQVMVPGEITSVYSMHDRMVTMGVVPKEKAISLPVLEDLTKADFFLQRRELGIINVGGNGTVTVDGEAYDIAHKECLYVGKGKKEVVFKSDSSGEPAEFYINSCPAHQEYPVKKASLSDANQVNLGSKIIAMSG